MAENYQEIVVKGPTLLVKGFASGWLVAKGLDTGAVIFAEERGIEVESLTEQMLEWLRLQSLSHLLAPHLFAGELSAAFKAAAESLKLAVVEEKTVKSATFRFSYKAFTEKLATEIETAIHSMPDRVTLSPGYQPVIKSDPNAKGVELYSPTHAYEASAAGELTGDLPAILAMHDRLKKFDMVTADPVRLSLS